SENALNLHEDDISYLIFHRLEELETTVLAVTNNHRMKLKGLMKHQA
ncbi:hypothetical protein AVEN_180615-1, partial [Araneus ventricosus]